MTTRAEEPPVPVTEVKAKAVSWAVLSVAVTPAATRFSTLLMVMPGSNTVAPVTRTVSVPEPPSTTSPAAVSELAV